MSAQTPGEAHLLWTQFLLAGDLEGQVSLYEPDALMVEVPQPGPIVRGHAAIREGLNKLHALKPQFELKILNALKCGDITILYSRWIMTGTDPDGNDVSMTGLTSDVVRRQPDGSWLFVIDNPVGGEGITVGKE
ncbi:MAG: nuclear transport factor 2 family protein [bacterium]